MSYRVLDVGRSSWTVLAIGSAIVVVVPFGADLTFITGTSIIGREVMFLVLAFTGLMFADIVGLRVSAVGFRHRFIMPLAVAAAVSAWVVIIDCAIFRSILPNDYVEIFRSNSLGARVVAFMTRAFIEEVVYRLFLMSFLAWMLGYLWRTKTGRPANGAFWTAMTLAQITNIGINVLAQNSNTTALTMVYDGLRFVIPGVVWGYLYWRRGFVAAEIAHVGAQLFLQPPLGYYLG